MRAMKIRGGKDEGRSEAEINERDAAEKMTHKIDL